MYNSQVIIVVSSILFAVEVASMPVGNLDSFSNEESLRANGHRSSIINSGLTAGTFDDAAYQNIRTKRSIAEVCEELELCKLHAQSRHSFLATFQLYFVNKENAKLWDHHQRSMSECESRYRECASRPAPARVHFADNNSIDDGDDVDDDY